MVLKNTLNPAQKARRILLSSLLVGCLLSPDTPAHAVSRAPVPPQSSKLRDGQHDFDFNIGTWKNPHSPSLASAYGLERLG